MKALYSRLQRLCVEQGYNVAEFGLNEQPQPRTLTISIGDITTPFEGTAIREAECTFTILRSADMEQEQTRIYNLLATCVPMDEREEDAHLALPDNSCILYLYRLPIDLNATHSFHEKTKQETASITFTITYSI